jgi:hypothetical protein
MYSMLLMLVILLMSLRLQLHSPQGTGWQLQAMAYPTIGRPAENHILASLGAPMLLG